ncbi:hypothetical protein SADUNF_Sadunf19G0079200 [Salix dunnii]|uniref:UBN2 domain-containing protein n=1 Tax=Salix dunnii TaxID=1413687 RepID=A0A835ML88_9ROSI|nr:hypothetical protein SADUNF_Sadunf19G0079200 [Salix dunnii]
MTDTPQQRGKCKARREKPKLFTKAFLQPKFNTDQHQDSPISSRIRQQDQEPPRTMMNGVSLPTHLNSHASSVPILTGTNFSEWKEQVEFTLGVLDLDLALLKDKPDPLTDKSTHEEKTLFNAWERSDRLSIMFLRMTIASNIKTSLPKPENAKDYMKAIEERFKTADNSLAGKLMADLTTIKFDGTRSMHEHELYSISITTLMDG